MKVDTREFTFIKRPPRRVLICFAAPGGVKNRAGRLAEALGFKYRVRLRGYPLTFRQAQRFAQLHAAGFDGDLATGTLIRPASVHLEGFGA